MSEYTLMRNKGKYTFEEEEREVEFEKKKSVGWETEYKAYRKNWLEYPEKHFVSEYPLNVDIELTTLCNLKCPMCFTTREDYEKFKKKEFMDFDLFQKIINEIAGKVPAIRFSSSGEQTLYPKFLECISYAKKSGIQEISMVTNGSKLNQDFIEQLVLSGVDWVIISVDGMNDNYEKIRYPMKFEQIVESLKNFKKIKSKFNKQKPVIQIQSIWPAIEKNYEEYYNFFKLLTDLMQFGILIDYQKVDKLVDEEFFCCPAIYQRVEIGYDGRVYPCCANNGDRIHIGDIKRETLYDIWHGKELNLFRKMHEENDYKSISMCRDCFLGKKIRRKEVKKIGNRSFVVNEYICRE